MKFFKRPFVNNTTLRKLHLPEAHDFLKSYCIIQSIGQGLISEKIVSKRLQFIAIKI